MFWNIWEPSSQSLVQSCFETKNAEAWILCTFFRVLIGSSKALIKMTKWENLRYSPDCHWWPIEWGIYFTEIKSCLRVAKLDAWLLMIIMITCILVQNGSCLNCVLHSGSWEHGEWSWTIDTKKTIYMFWSVITLNRGPIRMRKTNANWRAGHCCEHILETTAREIFAWPLVIANLQNVKKT